MLYCILHKICIQKKNTRFLRFGLWKTRFFRDFQTLDGSDFYSTSRGDLDTPFYKKKQKSKKIIFLAWERGGGPLKANVQQKNVLKANASVILAGD